MCSSWAVPSTSFTASLWFVVVLCANLLIQVENKSVFGIGTRIIGDQLLLKDILKTPPISLTEKPVIIFNYAIVEPITYIEIESDKNVYAIVNFSYEGNLVEGSISTMNGQQVESAAKPEPFEVLMQIYGFNRTMLNVSPAYILNKDQQFSGVLKPNYQQKSQQSLSLMQEDLNALDDLEEYDDDDVIDDDDTGHKDNITYEEDDFDDSYDKVIEQGQRQDGDFLVYETNQTSATATDLPTNHSLTFYYIDIYYITCVKFTIYEHYLYHSTNDYGATYIVEYGHISPTTLKAVVTDYRTTSLFVQMQMYGFHPTALPVDYKPFLSNSQTPTTNRPISSLRQLKILMNAQQSTNTQQQHHQQTDASSGGMQQQASTELGHQISPNNNNKNNGNNNCMQQVLSNIGSDSLSIFAHWSIFNMIVIIFVAMILM